MSAQTIRMLESRQAIRFAALLAAAILMCSCGGSQDATVSSYDEYPHSEFTVRLPKFLKQSRRKKDSDPFSFWDGTELSLSFLQRVRDDRPLAEMDDMDLLEVIFWSTMGDEKDMSGLRPVGWSGRSDEWVTFSKEETNISPYASYLRMVRKEKINICKAKACLLVYYDSKQRLHAYCVDESGQQVDEPWFDGQHCAFVIDTGIWKYAFRLIPIPQPEIMSQIRKGIQTFEEIQEEAVEPPQ